MTRTFAKGQSVVYSDRFEARSGYIVSDEGPIGLIINDWARGWNPIVAHDNVRSETDEERRLREQEGIYVRRQANDG